MTVKVMVTGAGGFVGGHVIEALSSMIENLDVRPTSRRGQELSNDKQIATLDVTDRKAVEEAIAGICPAHVIHLAGIAALPVADSNPDAAWDVHLGGTLNVARAIVAHAPHCRLIHVGSGQVYGASAASGMPMDERTLLMPTNTYTASKAAADLAIGAMARGELKCIRFRPFNHIGPGQSVDFVVASFAMQIARIEAGVEEAVIRVGNLDARRDFLDVRDVAAAYALAVERGDSLPPGMILNLASGRAHRVRDLLDELLGIARTPIAVEVDRSRLRDNDIPEFVGNASAARELLGWRPRFTLEQTLCDTLAAARLTVKAMVTRH
jgi:GDP-4-dehydro-6-deoxy-D-mannose reductase